MFIKYLKNLRAYPITLYTGRPDFNTITFTEKEVKKYSDLVIEDVEDPGYNKYLFEEYITDSVLTILLIPEVIQVEPEPPAPVGLQFLIIQAPGNILT